jgi:hypothetical protein
MARIKYGTIVTQINGSVGGNVFQNNAFGFTLKAKGSVRNPNSKKQNANKGYVSSVSKAWANLSDSDRAAWISYAATYPQPSRHSPTDYLSGYGLFLKWNQVYMTGTTTPGAIISAPPLVLPTSTVPTWEFRCYPSIHNLNQLNMSWSIESTDWLCNIELGAPMPAGQNFIGSKTRFMSVVTPSASAVGIDGPYRRTFGNRALPGQRVPIRWQLYVAAGGRVEAKQSAILTVVEYE